ncbi:MAG: bifunctional UDP-N-acetylglucosamine diphosphorylase/glucosamine-1-phosphate N-acetyltransferase GlmU [Betaproteobacteria bacterium]|nr:bifunctional UDP-N-acetylglucosamine diphosphorylase/glucosamine-1-phosphate N-acetyltransferase GlmU [Betaproteobacteria bacterium]
MFLEVIVLAAGQGKRMRSDLPKVLHPLAGRPLLAHVLETARALTPKRIFVVHGHGAQAVQAAFAGQQDLEWVLQAEQLGTGHAVQQALPRLSKDAMALILYGDVPLIGARTLDELVSAAREGLSLLTAEPADATAYGRLVRDSSGRVARIVEHKDASESERAIREINAGFYALSVARLAAWLPRMKNQNAQKEYYLTDIVGFAVGEGVPVAAVKAADPWEVAGVNSKRELAELEREVQRREAARLMESGATLADPSRIDVRGTVQCGRDVSIDVNCVFEGRVALGDGVVIGPNCVLRDVSIGSGTQVLAFSHLQEAEVGAHCRIGPYARLRPGATLAEDVHVGNFVEVKASRLGAGSKANHLAYVGDSQVGRRVNIGAGTITCNYDGSAKHRTVIEDECFIGSDSTLVAPVRISRGSYIGAGSTITKDTPPGQLTVGRAKQVSIPSWKPKKKA